MPPKKKQNNFMRAEPRVEPRIEPRVEPPRVEPRIEPRLEPRLEPPSAYVASPTPTQGSLNSDSTFARFNERKQGWPGAVQQVRKSDLASLLLSGGALYTYL